MFFNRFCCVRIFFWKIAHPPSPSKKSLSVPNAFLTLYVFVWTKTKQNNFVHTTVFVVFTLRSSSLENEYFLMRFRPSSCKTPVNVDGSDSIWRFFNTVFKSLRFHLSTLLETARFQNDTFFLKKTPFSKNRFHKRFWSFFKSVDDRRKRFKKYAFSLCVYNENELVWLTPKFMYAIRDIGHKLNSFSLRYTAINLSSCEFQRIRNAKTIHVYSNS